MTTAKTAPIRVVIGFYCTANRNSGFSWLDPTLTWRVPVLPPTRTTPTALRGRWCDSPGLGDGSPSGMSFRLFCLVYSGRVKTSFRSKGRVASGVVLLFVVSAIMVPLFVACAILASESPMPHEQFIRISRATNMLGWLCLLVQVGAGWLVYSGFSIQKVLVRRLLWLAGILLSAVICSFVCGFLVSGVAEHKWYDIA